MVFADVKWNVGLRARGGLVYPASSWPPTARGLIPQHPAVPPCELTEDKNTQRAIQKNTQPEVTNASSETERGRKAADGEKNRPKKTKNPPKKNVSVSERQAAERLQEAVGGKSDDPALF